jgi:hypothetical protein
VATSLFLIVLTSSTLISGIVISTQSINSGGTITSMNVEIFNNIECTQTCTNINWGTLAPGESTNQTIYIKNTGNKQITLILDTENWIPENASNYLTLNWDKESTNLQPDQLTMATLILSADLDIISIDNFVFDIIIIGVE